MVATAVQLLRGWKRKGKRKGKNWLWPCFRASKFELVDNDKQKVFGYSKETAKKRTATQETYPSPKTGVPSNRTDLHRTSMRWGTSDFWEIEVLELKKQKADLPKLFCCLASEQAKNTSSVFATTIGPIRKSCATNFCVLKKRPPKHHHHYHPVCSQTSFGYYCILFYLPMFPMFRFWCCCCCSDTNKIKTAVFQHPTQSVWIEQQPAHKNSVAASH